MLHLPLSVALLGALPFPIGLTPQDDPTPAVGERGTLEMQTVRIALARGGHVDAERGMLFVPLVRADPASKTIGVEVYRFFAEEGASPDTPPLFMLHGGPGWPGLGGSLERPGFYESEVAPLTRACDLVVVGQRGIGASIPNTLCDDFAPQPLPDAASQADQDAALRAACQACKAHWESQGYDLRGFNVIEAAADLEDTRRLLGYEQVSLWGASFGSHWGMAMIRYHPESVARAVLTGMEGPDHTYDMPSGVLDALEMMAGEAEVSPELVGAIPEGGLIEALKAVIASVEEEPVEVELLHPASGEPVVVRVDGDVVREGALGYTGRVSSRRSAGTWAADVLALHRGDFEVLARAWLAQRDEGPDGLPTASFFMLDCGSGISPGRLAELDADPAVAVVGELGRFYRTACPAWDADLGDDFRAGFVSDVPTVIVHGTWDISTPFSNALECLPMFDAGHLVVVDGGTHSALDEAMSHSPDFAAALLDFVATGDTSNLPEEIRLPPIAWSGPHGPLTTR